MLSGCFGSGVVLFVVCCRGRGLIFFPMTVQTEPALGAFAAVAAKDGRVGGAGGVLLTVMGWEAQRPGCGVLAVGLSLRYSACRVLVTIRVVFWFS